MCRGGGELVVAIQYPCVRCTCADARLRGGGQLSRAAVRSVDAHAMPVFPVALKPQPVAQRDRISQHPVEKLPRQLGPCAAEGACGARLCLGPQATAAAIGNELPRLDGQSAVLLTDRTGQQHAHQQRKRHTTLWREVYGSLWQPFWEAGRDERGQLSKKRDGLARSPCAGSFHTVLHSLNSNSPTHRRGKMHACHLRTHRVQSHSRQVASGSKGPREVCSSRSHSAGRG